MKIILVLTLVLMSSLSIINCGGPAKNFLKNQPDGLYGELVVNEQSIFFTLYYQEVPLAVSNFVGLATGKFSEHIERKGNYFEGITFHRVVNDFVIQGGDPTGTGAGGPGYNFIDEFSSVLQHDSAGILSMANSGPNTNGSQFFITLAPTPHLDGRHSVFGKVQEGKEIPATVVQGDVIQSINILAKGKDAKNFLEGISWDEFQSIQTETTEQQQKEAEEEKQSILSEIKVDSELTETQEGLFYKLEKEGTGALIKNGDTVKVHYELKLFGDSAIIDSSFSRNQPFDLQVGSGRVIAGWELILQKLRVGDKALVIIPPELGYGEQGAGNVIPGGAFLSFVIEVLSIE